MSRNCSHDQCEPYNSCIAGSDYDRREYWWRGWQRGKDREEPTDPIAYLDGAYDD